MKTDTDKEFDKIFERVFEEVFYEIKLGDEQKEYLYWRLFKEWCRDSSLDDLLETTECYFDYLAHNGDI